MTSLIPQADICDPKALAVMGQAFVAIWNALGADNPLRYSEHVADRVTDPIRPRNLTWKACLPHRREAFVLAKGVQAMNRLLHSTATVALLVTIATISFTPASALVTAPDRKLYVGSSVTPVHCQKKYHCHWRGEGANRSKHCHICG